MRLKLPGAAVSNGIKVFVRWRAEIAEDLRSALQQIESVLGDLQQRVVIAEAGSTSSSRRSSRGGPTM